MIEDYFLHFLLSSIGALIGVYAKSWCRHLTHQFAIATLLLLIETIVVVNVVG